MAEQTIVCPNCGKKIALSQALTQQIEATLRDEFAAQAAKNSKEVEQAYKKKIEKEINDVRERARVSAMKENAAELSKIRRELSQATQREQSAKAEFERQMSAERIRLERTARKAAEERISSKVEKLEEQLREGKRQANQFKIQSTELQKLQAKLASQEKTQQIEIERRLKEASRKVKEKISEELEEKFEQREIELQRKLSDAKRKASELERKLDQSSQNIRGVVSEEKLEDLLRKAFRDDEIVSISRRSGGGADVLQKVLTSNGQYCGSIIWESKNTQIWQNSWLKKLRIDQRRAKADVAVLATKVLPSNVKHFAQVDGVWVAEISVAVGVATAIRGNLIQVAGLKQLPEGNHEKFELLYNYLSSTEFRHRIEAIVEAFKSMQDELDKERRSMERQWAQRGMHIHAVIQNVAGMYGEMQGIAGKALPRIKRLELASD